MAEPKKVTMPIKGIPFTLSLQPDVGEERDRHSVVSVTPHTLYPSETKGGNNPQLVAIAAPLVKELTASFEADALHGRLTKSKGEVEKSDRASLRIIVRPQGLLRRKTLEQDIYHFLEEKLQQMRQREGSELPEGVQLAPPPRPPRPPLPSEPPAAAKLTEEQVGELWSRIERRTGRLLEALANGINDVPEDQRQAYITGRFKDEMLKQFRHAFNEAGKDRGPPQRG